MSLPGGGTWTYTYSDSSAVGDDLVSALAGGPTAPAMLPQDDPNSVAYRLERISDDQGRLIDVDVDETGKVGAERSNQTFDVYGDLVSDCRTDHVYDVGQPATVDPNNYAFTTVQTPSHFWLSQVKTTWNILVSGTWQQTRLAENDYTYDNTGQRLTNQVTDNTGVTRTEQYSYDDLNRLSSVNYGDAQTQGYTFDPMGNRLSRTDSVNGSTSYGFNAANMLTSAGGNAYTSDADGNTLTGGGRTNTWDSENRLTSSTVGGVTSTYTYGADGLRRSSTVNGITTDYVYDGQSMVEELRGGAVYATYLTGPRGPEYRRDANGAVSWYVYDGLGSVVAEVAPDGTVTASEKYDVYGALRAGSGGGSTTRHHFVGGLGHIADQETGLIYMRARYYDPAVGRFVSQDSKQNGYNWFVYCRDNPVNAVDPDGKSLRQIANVILAMMSISALFGISWPQFMGLVEAVWNLAAERIAMSAIIQGIGVTIGERSPQYADLAQGVVSAGAGLSVVATISAIAAIHALAIAAIVLDLDEQEKTDVFQ